MNTYLHVGTNYLNNITFQSVKDDIFPNKPNGGLWLTCQDPKNTIGNEWIEYLSWHPFIAIYAHYLNLNGTMVCLLIELKNNAKIFTLDSFNKLNYLNQKYPKDNFFSYEALSQDYDGIYIDIYKFYSLPIYKEYFEQFSVNTLLLFNFDCISHYFPGSITIEDLDENYNFNFYQINLSSKKQEITPIPLKYQLFQAKVNKFLIKYLKEQEIKITNINNSQTLINLVKEKYDLEIKTLAHENNLSESQLTLSLISHYFN